MWLIFKEISNQCAEVSVSILSQFGIYSWKLLFSLTFMSTTQGQGKYDSGSDTIYTVLHTTWWSILIYDFDKTSILYNNCVSPSFFIYSGFSFTYSVKFSWWYNRVTLINCELLPLLNVFRLQKHYVLEGKIGLSLQACCWNIILSQNLNSVLWHKPEDRGWSCPQNVVLYLLY